MSRYGYLAVAAVMLGSALLGSVLTQWIVPNRGAAAQPTPIATRVVTAQALQLVDTDGTVRGELYAQPDGGVALTLRDQHRRPRAELGVRADGGGRTQFFDEAGTQRAAVGLTTSGDPVVTVYDPEQKARLALGVAPWNFGYPRDVLWNYAPGEGRLPPPAPVIQFFDRDGARRMTLGVGPNNDPSVTLSDGRIGRLGLFVHPDGQTAVNFRDGEGYPVRDLP